MNLQRIKDTILYHLQRFFYGRYGFDQLSWILLGIAMLASLVARMANIPWLVLVYYGGFFTCIARVVSRNIYKRQQENRWLLSKLQVLTAWGRIGSRMFSERKTHQYLRCTNCRQWLRVPRGKGKIKISCSKCGSQTTKTV